MTEPTPPVPMINALAMYNARRSQAHWQDGRREGSLLTRPPRLQEKGRLGNSCASGAYRLSLRRALSVSVGLDNEKGSNPKTDETTPSHNRHHRNLHRVVRVRRDETSRRTRCASARQ